MRLLVIITTQSTSRKIWSWIICFPVRSTLLINQEHASAKLENNCGQVHHIKSLLKLSNWNLQDEVSAQGQSLSQLLRLSFQSRARAMPCTESVRARARCLIPSLLGWEQNSGDASPAFAWCSGLSFPLAAPGSHQLSGLKLPLCPVTPQPVWVIQINLTKHQLQRGLRPGNIIVRIPIEAT